MKKITLLVALFACSNAFASPSKLFWSDIQSAESKPVLQKDINAMDVKPALNKRSLMLNEQGLKEALMSKGKGLSARAVNNKSSYPEVDLPLPDGSFARVRVIPSSILAPAIAEQYPDIKTWRVEGVDTVISGRLDFTSAGFHGMLIMPDGDTIFIDPDKSVTSNRQYQSLSKSKNSSRFKTDFKCTEQLLPLRSEKEQSKKLAKAPTPAFETIKYRLALAGTAEYTADQGGTQASAYASMITTINRVNATYQRDLGIEFELVTNESFAYMNTATDPYTSNSSLDLVHENIESLNNRVQKPNYDIGHVFDHAAFGGLAYVGATCNDNTNLQHNGVIYTGAKAGGASGIPDPDGEIFSIEIVAHELGHQMGANHTFNSETHLCSGGGRTATSAVEPGSGSTIMAYAGVCDTDNLQNDTDDMFHWKSISEIIAYTRAGGDGESCGDRRSAANNDPVADAGADIKIPTKTPFMLDGSATGLEAAETFTYTWDQMDTGAVSTVSEDKGDNAIIRALLPSPNEDRYIPRLSDLFAGTTTVGELLPQVARDVNFAYVVRDGNGGVDSDEKLVEAFATGQIFRISSHSVASTISAGADTTVDWNVAGTDGGSINCLNVDVNLIRSNGDKVALLANTPNDASEQVTIPSATAGMNDARMMVICSDQSFFQVSAGNTTILDTQKPEITILGDNPATVVKGSVYADAGASTQDNTDADGVATISSGSVDTSVVGPYDLVYSAIDVAGNVADNKTRRVNVIIDTVPPVITMQGSNPASVNQGVIYIDAGATAIDAIDGNIVVIKSSNVNTSVAGDYTVTYTATDSSNNSSNSLRVVKVIADNTAPVITLLGSSTMSITKGTAYAEPGATAVDAVSGNVNVVITGSVNKDTVGTYILTYTATDVVGNASTETRTVKVVKVAPPSGGGSADYLFLGLLLLALRKRLLFKF